MRLPVTSLLAILGVMVIFMVLGLASLFALMLPVFLVMLVLTQIDVSSIFYEKIRPRLSKAVKQQKGKHATGSGMAVRRGRFDTIIEAKPITADSIMTALKPFMSISMVRKLEKYMVEKVRTAIFESGYANDSIKIARHNIMYAILSIPPCVAVGIILALMFHPGFLGLFAVPAAVMFSGLIQLKTAKSQRRSAIGHELPVFIACASIMEKVGVSFYEFIGHIAESKTTLFPALKQDAKIFQRNVRYLAMSHTTALRKVAETHPNDDFKDLVTNYASAYSTSGTNTANTMMAATESAFRVMRNSVKAYTSEANSMAQLVLMLMAMMPMLAISTTFIATGKGAASMNIMVMIILPFIIIVLLMGVDGKQPRTHNTIPMYRPPLVMAVISVPITVILGVPLWGILGVAAITWSGANAFMTRKHFADVSKMDAALPAFAQFVTDSRLEGMDIREAVAIRSSTTDKKDVLGPMLRDMAKRMMFGKTLAAAAETVRIKSWLSRILFFVLSQVQESGGGDTHSLQSFTNFVKDYVESRREMMASLRGSMIMGYVIPILMVGMFLMTSEMINSVVDELDGLENMPINFPSVEDTQQTAKYTSFIIVECTVLIGILVSKLTFFTLKHSLHVCIMSVFGTVLCIALPFLQELVSELL